jgi:hypothetical protein
MPEPFGMHSRVVRARSGDASPSAGQAEETAPSSQRLKELDEVALLRLLEAELEHLVVVLHDVGERRGRAVVELVTRSGS